MPKFVIRFDDINSKMAWSKFSIFEVAIVDLNIHPIIGVVPNCLDKEIEIEPALVGFWDKIREWSAFGWTIAQHGYTHQYETHDSGLLSVNNNSEFSGLPYKTQFAKLKAGKDILHREGVWEPVYMAPAHSFDDVTLLALAALEFRYLTDGYGFYPHDLGSLAAVPQLFASTLHFGFGVYTICLHVNTMTESQILNMIAFMRRNSRNFISFKDAVNIRCPVPAVASFSRIVTSSVIRTVRAIRRM